MLNTLRRIVQEVNAAPDLEVALDVMVHRVKEAMKTQVTSVYLLDYSQNRYILMATKGLRQEAVGKASLGFSEGLVGQVGLREEPINSEKAASHPKFRFLEETGEEEFEAFLGVPIIHHRKVLGVLVVQHREARAFSQSDEAFLVTVSAQLSGVIAHAEATGVIKGLGFHETSAVAKFTGVAGASGIGIGTGLLYYPATDLTLVPDKKAKNIAKELEVLNDALEAARNDIKSIAKAATDSLGPEESALFDVYIRMLDDNAIGGEIVEKVKGGQWAQGALREVISAHVRGFEMMEDPYLRERAADVKDLGLRVLTKLQEHDHAPIEYPEFTILVADELTTSVILEVPREKLVGVVTVQGSTNSHMAIVARGMGIPTVVGAVGLPIAQLQGRELVVDGYRGEVISNPSAELRGHYESIIEEEKELAVDLEGIVNKESVMPDGHEVTLWVNTGLMADVVLSLNRGAAGVGLYRTEIPFMTQDRFPSEEEQASIYRQQLAAFAPSPVTMRTLDIGGDKSLSYFPIVEENPFLGWRGIRVTLDHPEIFMVQVRAMLKASEGLDNLRIMLPMVSTVFEAEEAMHLIHRAYLEVLEEGFHVVMPPVGVMIEVPSAVYQAREFAQRVDFLSVGSNDLTQYLLAVDRNNPRVAGLYHSYHPAVLQALKIVVDQAALENTPVSICGEMAGDPGLALVLIAMGYNTLSMSASSLLKVKWAIRKVPFSRAKVLLEDVMSMDNAEVIRSYLDFAMAKQGLGGFVRPGNRN
ncbi:MAG: phosphoenolpyruvate--protein phosphotransferase [Pseudomonadales bacterium]|nr:phosphoenolpyruvate--protein phosphotransferase [Pseudomonadales bacterium]